MKHIFKSLTLAATIVTSISVTAAQAPENAREAAPHDLTGYWVSIVTEDWRYRMMTAPAGDYQGLPLTPQAQEVAKAWDPQADTAAGMACKAYGAGGLMRIPTRLHIAWVNDNVAAGRISEVLVG